jgi:hypothetical protein
VRKRSKESQDKVVTNNWKKRRKSLQLNREHISNRNQQSPKAGEKSYNRQEEWKKNMSMNTTVLEMK